jgi:hypothetical protein
MTHSLRCGDVDAATRSQKMADVTQASVGSWCPSASPVRVGTTDQSNPVCCVVVRCVRCCDCALRPCADPCPRTNPCPCRLLPAIVALCCACCCDLPANDSDGVYVERIHQPCQASQRVACSRLISASCVTPERQNFETWLNNHACQRFGNTCPDVRKVDRGIRGRRVKIARPSSIANAGRTIYCSTRCRYRQPHECRCI